MNHDPLALSAVALYRNWCFLKGIPRFGALESEFAISDFITQLGNPLRHRSRTIKLDSFLQLFFDQLTVGNMNA